MRPFLLNISKLKYLRKLNKQTLRGSFFRLENDFWGNAPIYWAAGLGGNYFARNADPGDLLYELENMLRSDNDFSPEKRARLTDLKNSISEDDNNWILFARMRRQEAVLKVKAAFFICFFRQKLLF